MTLHFIDSCRGLERFILHMENNWVRGGMKCVCVCKHLYRSAIVVENLHHLDTQYLLILSLCVLFFKMGAFTVGNQKIIKDIKNVLNAVYK